MPSTSGRAKVLYRVPQFILSVRPQILELISRHNHNARRHRVMTEPAKFVAGHLVGSWTLKTYTTFVIYPGTTMALVFVLWTKKP